MVVQHFIAVLLVSVCAATRIQFPEKNACILIDFETNNSLSWTRENGTEMAIPNWDISNFSVPEGNCTGTPYLVIKFRVDNATLRFDFHNASGKVDLRMTLKFEPDVVFAAFNNTDQTPVEIKSALAAGSTEKAFKCNSEQKAPGKKMVGKDEYKITYRITNLKTQGYGVENGTYSKDTEECSEDNPTTAPPNTTVTTAPPNTTVTTAPPNTTVTTAPPNTTVTTAPPNTTVTTAPPNTTVTTHPPTTTTQPPNAPKVTLYATDGNKTCAMMQGAFTFKIPYNTTTKTEGSTATVEIPKDVNSTGNCMNQNKTDVLMARFGDGWEMDFVFKGDGTYIWLDQLNMTVVYDKAFFPDIDGNKTGTKATFNKSFSQLFKAKKDGSYLCNSDTTTELTNGITMMTKNFQYTALGNNVTKFSDKDIKSCNADAKTSSVVPIAVGAALAGLVVIVLIAYLIGRRRNRKGYESV